MEGDQVEVEILVAIRLEKGPDHSGSFTAPTWRK
jgi:hypothetical protein